jgi:hypothetical protein
MRLARLTTIAASTAVLAFGVATATGASVGAAVHRTPVVRNGGARPFSKYTNKLTKNTDGWCDAQGSEPCDGNYYGTIDIVSSSNSNGGGANYAPSVPGPAGAHKYARVTGGGPAFGGYQTTSTGCPVPGSENCSGPYTDWGNATPPDGFPTSTGFTTSIEIYLDTAWADANPGQVVDWDTALGTNTGGFLQDYVFNLCTTSAGGGGFYISASNNAGACSTGPTEITTSGWYTFDEQFSAVGLSNPVLVESGTVLNADAQSVFSNIDDTGDAISGVGGPWYGWLPDEDVNGLPIADATLRF